MAPATPTPEGLENVMRSVVWIIAAALVGMLAATLTGCQAEKESVGWDYGKAFHTVFENQKIDPHAGDDTPITSMDGTRAALAYERLEKQAPEEKNQQSGSFEAFLQQKK